MKTTLVLALLFMVIPVFPARVAGNSEIDGAFQKDIDHAISEFIAQRHDDLVRPKEVTIYLISPVAYTEVEFEKAKKDGVDAEPFWISGRPHRVFKSKVLADAIAAHFGRSLYVELTYPETHDEIRLTSFCLFRPMHAFKVAFSDGKELEGAVCVHCGDLMFKLPRSNMEEFRGVQTKELVASFDRIMPIPKALEVQFFPEK